MGYAWIDWYRRVDKITWQNAGRNLQLASRTLILWLILQLPPEIVLIMVINNWFMLSVRISSYGCTREVWRAREKRKLIDHDLRNVPPNLKGDVNSEG